MTTNTPSDPRAELARVVEILRKAKAPPISGEFVCGEALRAACVGFIDRHADLLTSLLSSHGVGGEAVAWGVRDHTDGKIWMVDTSISHASKQAELNDDTFVPLYEHPAPPPQPRAEGMVLVPRYPTEAMLRAAIGVKRPIVQTGPSMHIGTIWSSEIYEAMLAAAPCEGSAAPRVEQSCTCHPDDRPAICQRRYAASECIAAARRATQPGEQA